MRLKKTSWFDPYDKSGKCNLKDTGAGVYLITRDSKLLYIGYSGTDVKKTMYRHFQSWNDKTQQRFTYSKQGTRARVIWTSTAKAAFDLENSLILRLKPKDNINKLDTYQQRAKDIEKEYLDAEQIKPDEPCPF
jgi:excinuclease UvrABC nuclease subunit